MLAEWLVAQSSSESEGISVELLAVAAAVGVVWLVLTAVLAAVRQPPRIRAAAATQELPPESPAVAGMLCDDFELPSEVVPATLLDLAARRVVTLEEVQPGHTICRIGRAGSNGSLREYEQRVLSAVSDKAIDGVVPTGALTTGTEGASKGWQKAYTKEVIAESHALGLTRDRWPARVVGIVGLGPIVAVGLVIVAAFVGGDTSGDRGVVAAVVGGVAGIAIVALFTIAGRLGRSLAQLPTDDGERAAAICLGLEAHLRENEHFDDLPPAAVTIWGRHFAYAGAMGIARTAVELLPMGAEDDHRAWSRFGGRWRRVQVRYPRARPPGWGKHPAFALFLALLWGAVAVFALRGLVGLAQDIDESSLESTFELSQEQLDWIGRGALIAAIPFALLALWALYVLVRAVPDLWLRRTITGEIVRARTREQAFKSGNTTKYWYYLALDDGRHTKIRAFRVRKPIYDAHRQGATVTAVCTPNLGYVREVRVATSPDDQARAKRFSGT